MSEDTSETSTRLEPMVMLPCPFCGDEPTVSHVPWCQYVDRSGSFGVGCTRCAVEFIGYTTEWDFEINQRIDNTHEVMNTIRARWNSRSVPAT